MVFLGFTLKLFGKVLYRAIYIRSSGLTLNNCSKGVYFLKYAAVLCAAQIKTSQNFVDLSLKTLPFNHKGEMLSSTYLNLNDYGFENLKKAAQPLK